MEDVKQTVGHIARVHANDLRYTLLDAFRGEDGVPGASVEQVQDFIVAFLERWPHSEEKADHIMSMTDGLNRSLPLNKISAPLIYRFLKQCGMFMASDPNFDFRPRKYDAEPGG